MCGNVKLLSVSESCSCDLQADEEDEEGFSLLVSVMVTGVLVGVL